MFGLLNVDKPAGVTSRDVVNHVQRLIRPVKVGHAGTLDPLATGVLVICVGPATRLVPFIQQQHKVYRATFLLGVTSNTDDVEGDVQPIDGARHVTRQDIASLIPKYTGVIQQVPPQFSAVKVKGRRAYQQARRGREVRLEPRPVEIHRLELLEVDERSLSLEIECGSGTYIRSLGRDLGADLGSGAVMSALRRTRIGPFVVENAVGLDAIQKSTFTEMLLPAKLALHGIPDYVASAADVALLSSGRTVETTGQDYADGVQVAVVDAQGELVCVAESQGHRLAPRTVFRSA